MLHQAIEALSLRIVASETKKTLEAAGDRIKTRVSKLARTIPFDHGRAMLAVDRDRPATARCCFAILLAAHVLLQIVHKSRLAQTCFANQKNNLTHAFLSLLPTTLQEAHFLIATS